LRFSNKVKRVCAESPDDEEEKNLTSLKLHQFEVQHLPSPSKIDSGESLKRKLQ